MRDRLVGTWELVGWTRPSRPDSIPPAFVGRLTYTNEGRMSVVIHARERGVFRAPNPLDATDEEAARAARGAVAYAGRWRVREREGEAWVEHLAEASLFPNYVEGPVAWRRRALRWLGEDEMELTAQRGAGDATSLRWRRLRD